MKRVELLAVEGVPLVQPGDDLPAVLLDALAADGVVLDDGDVLVVASKLVSKAEGRIVDLATVPPSAEAEELAAKVDKDPRVVELVLRESTHVSRAVKGVLLVRHRLGFVSANAGLDRSNLEGEEAVLLLPLDPDASARAIRERCRPADVGVVIADTHGRAFRQGNVGVAIGVAGIEALIDMRGDTDLFGRVLEATMVPMADQLAGAGTMVGGEAAEGLPLVVVRGLRPPSGDGRAAELVWPPEMDLYA